MVAEQWHPPAPPIGLLVWFRGPCTYNQYGGPNFHGPVSVDVGWFDGRDYWASDPDGPALLIASSVVEWRHLDVPTIETESFHRELVW